MFDFKEPVFGSVPSVHESQNAGREELVIQSGLQGMSNLRAPDAVAAPASAYSIFMKSLKDDEEF